MLDTGIQAICIIQTFLRTFSHSFLPSVVATVSNIIEEYHSRVGRTLFTNKDNNNVVRFCVCENVTNVSTRHMLNQSCTVSVSESVEIKLLYSIFSNNLLIPKELSQIRNDFKTRQFCSGHNISDYERDILLNLGSFITNSKWKNINDLNKKLYLLSIYIICIPTSISKIAELRVYSILFHISPNNCGENSNFQASTLFQFCVVQLRFHSD